MKNPTIVGLPDTLVEGLGEAALEGSNSQEATGRSGLPCRSSVMLVDMHGVSGES
jgi:hypothetical protein